MATVTANGISGIRNSTATGVPATSPQAIDAGSTTIIASSSHSSCRRAVSVPRR